MDHRRSTAVAPIVEEFYHAATGTFSYLVFDAASLHGAVIDPVLDFDRRSGRISTESIDRILRRVRDLGLTVDWVLETHVHADHISAIAHVKDRLQCQTAIGSGVCRTQAWAARLFGFTEDFVTDGSQFDRLWQDNDAFTMGTIVCRVMETPGHTPDSVTYLIGDMAFIGDTLFVPEVGSARCDFPLGSSRQLFASVQRLYQLADSTKLMMCHDYPTAGRNPMHATTVLEQKNANVHLNSAASVDQFCALRDSRDRTLPVPELYHFALQMNVRAGRLPPPQSNGVHYLYMPVHSIAGAFTR